MVVAADKIHNSRTIVEDYYDSHQRYIQDFGKNFDERIDVYHRISEILNKRLENPILEEFNHVYEEYQEFLHTIKVENDNNYD